MKALLNFNWGGALALFLLICWTGCTSSSYREQTYQGGALGTSYAIKVFTADTADLQSQIDSVFRVINTSLSTYLPESDISRINGGDSSVVVDAMFREVFETSVEVHARTRGYFDPTVGVLVDAWGFGPGPSFEMDSVRVDSLLEYVGLEKVRLTPEGKIIKANPGIRLDFNAIAKGYAIDRLAIMLDAAGISDYLVEVGGELRAKGENRVKQQPWAVGIDDPQVVTGRAIKKIISLTDRSMASSGNYRKFRVDSVTGQKYVHTIDPHTGFTRNSNVLATSVLASTCMEADAYATAFMAMDLEESKRLLSEINGLEGYIIYLNAQGETKEYTTPGFEEVVQEP